MSAPDVVDSSAAAVPAEPVLQLRGVTKRFGGATALDDVSFDLLPGEIHGLVGENGAGKRTLRKILSGVHTPDEGEIMLHGERVVFSSPKDAKAHGVGMIYQELSCMPQLSIAENVFLGRHLTGPGGLIAWSQMQQQARADLAELGLQVDPTAPLGRLSLGNQQLVEIARVVFSGANIVVLDEPTSALSGPEAQKLFEAMNNLRAKGRSLIFISHFLEDVLAVSDRVTVLKNSRKVATLPRAGLTKHRLIELMIGRDAEQLAETYEEGIALPPPSTTRAVLDVDSLSSPGAYEDVTFQVHAGEILGIFGNLGAGMTEIARTLFGQLPPANGRIMLDGVAIAPRSTTQAKNLGIAYLSENRRKTIFPRHEIFKNISLAHLDSIVGHLMRQDREIAVATDLVSRTGTRPANPLLLAGNLSGGNQQKVVLAKWLTTTPKVLILNEPTRGMDVGAKREVLDLVKTLKAEGVAILLLSTEPETVMAESDRVIVMSRGRITREFAGERVSKDLLMEWA
ncbi:MAG: sugar ABC transporter ATP-binding protein [Thermomicrobiales bacterium]